ncbi:MAG TPA: M48 family metallopeptidase, partial [Gemmatimonadaceae bacterium]|nr:M48 family metallopeptidase [Gemmatimonadaceae bacterium]
MRSRSEWSGFYYDGRSAHRERVTVTVGADALQLHRSDGQTVAWPFEGVRQTQGSYSGERLRLEFGTDRVEVLFVQQDGLPEAVRQIAPGAMRGLRARQSTAKILALSLGLVALLVTGYVLAARAIVSWLTPRVPVEWEVSLGHGVVERMAPVEQRCDDTSAVAGVRGIVERLAAVAPSPYDFQVFVTRDSTVNAFAAPGGFLVVNGGLLAAAQTPEQLAGVLAHEIQHVVHRHTTRALLREAPPRLLLSALGGSVIEAAASAVVTLNSLRYMRADEAEADRDAVHMLAAAHIDPVAMVQFMRILGAD